MNKTLWALGEIDMHEYFGEETSDKNITSTDPIKCLYQIRNRTKWNVLVCVSLTFRFGSAGSSTSLIVNINVVACDVWLLFVVPPDFTQNLESATVPSGSANALNWLRFDAI